MNKTWTTMTALAVVLILAGSVMVACEEDTASQPTDPTGISVDVDRSKPRPKMSAPKVTVPKAPAPKGGKRR